MRLSELATTLAPHEGMTPDALLGVLRGPAIVGLLDGQPGRGRTSPNDYHPAEIARARLLLAARDCGLTGQDLADFNAALNQPPTHGDTHPPSAQADGAVFHPSALHSIIRGTRAGETWVVSFRVTRNAKGQRIVAPSVFWPDGAVAGTHDAWALDLLEGVTHLGTLTVPASDLIRPLLADLGG